MFKFLFLLFIVIPIIEIALLMQIGAWIGLWPTIAIVIVTAWLGAKNVKQQGLSTLNSLQTKVAQGQAPSEEIISGLMLLIAGVLLVTPGFTTDIFGLLLLIPAFRKSIANLFKKFMPVQAVSGASFQHQTNYRQEESVNEDVFSNHKAPPDAAIQQGKTLDGEFERKE